MHHDPKTQQDIRDQLDKDMKAYLSRGGGVVTLPPCAYSDFQPKNHRFDIRATKKDR